MKDEEYIPDRHQRLIDHIEEVAEEIAGKEGTELPKAKPDIQEIVAELRNRYILYCDENPGNKVNFQEFSGVPEGYEKNIDFPSEKLILLTNLQGMLHEVVKRDLRWRFHYMRKQTIAKAVKIVRGKLESGNLNAKTIDQNTGDDVVIKTNFWRTISATGTLETGRINGNTVLIDMSEYNQPKDGGRAQYRNWLKENYVKSGGNSKSRLYYRKKFNENNPGKYTIAALERGFDDFADQNPDLNPRKKGAKTKVRK